MSRKKKQRRGYGITKKMEDGSICTLQHYTDGTSSFNIATLGIKDGAVSVINDYLEFKLPKRESSYE